MLCFLPDSSCPRSFSLISIHHTTNCSKPYPFTSTSVIAHASVEAAAGPDVQATAARSTASPFFFFLLLFVLSTFPRRRLLVFHLLLSVCVALSIRRRDAIYLVFRVAEKDISQLTRINVLKYAGMQTLCLSYSY